MEEEERSVRQLHLQTLESHRLANEQMQMQQHLAHRQRVREVKLANYVTICRNKMQLLDAEIKNFMPDTRRHFDMQLQYARLRHAYQHELEQMQQKNNEEAQRDHAAYMAWCRQHNIQASQ